MHPIENQPAKTNTKLPPIEFVWGGSGLKRTNPDSQNISESVSNISENVHSYRLVHFHVVSTLVFGVISVTTLY